MKCFCQAGLAESVGQADLPVACGLCGGSGSIETHLDLLDVGQMPEGSNPPAKPEYVKCVWCGAKWVAPGPNTCNCGGYLDGYSR